MAKKESTGDLPKAVQDYMDKLKVSAEEYAQKVEDAKSFDIDPHLVKLMWDEPFYSCLLYTSPSPRDKRQSRMPSSA